MPLPFPAHNHWPVPIPPDRLPKPCKAEGPFAPNKLLHKARRLFEGKVVGSESVAISPDGRLVMLDRYGYVWTASSDKHELDEQPLAYVGPGRPLGFHFTATGDLVICDSLKGLMLLERPADGGHGSQWRLRCLANHAGGRPISYANDLALARDGRIYFSDSSVIGPALNEASPTPWYDTMRSYLLTMWHGEPTGRLLCHDPASGRTEVLEDKLWYANGVALAPDESFVAVVETCSMRVRRRWLKGPKAGTLDTLIDQLPGWPDNIVEASDGNFWLCLVLPDMPLAHKVLPRPWLRRVVAKLPDWLLPPKPQWGCVAKVSPQGRVLAVLMDPQGGRVSHVSSVTEHAGRLYLGNLAKDYVSVLDLAEVAGAAEAPEAAAAS